LITNAATRLAPARRQFKRNNTFIGEKPAGEAKRGKRQPSPAQRKPIDRVARREGVLVFIVSQKPLRNPSPIHLGALMVNLRSSVLLIIVVAAAAMHFSAPLAWAVSLDWVRQFGTTSLDWAWGGHSADSLGNIYISGYTLGSLGAANAGGWDAVVVKYDEAGSQQWTRQLGTSQDDWSYSVSADGLGAIYISGETRGSLDSPNAGNNDAFVAKYDATGNLQWTRQVGSSASDVGNGIAADHLGNVFITGYTSGSLSGPNAGNNDAFVAKYDAAGNLQWTRQLGTSASDVSNGVSADGLGYVYITGSTAGSIGGPSAGSNDAFVAKYDAAGNLQWTRQLGSSAIDVSNGVLADSLGYVYISGNTQGSLGGPNAGSDDAFVSKYDAAGNLLWTRQLGTAELDRSMRVSADGLGNAYITGFTGGNLDGSNAGAFDAFVAKYDAPGNLQWTKQLGTAGDDWSRGVSADDAGNVYTSGDTLGSLGGSNAGESDLFLAKYIKGPPGDLNSDNSVDGADYIVWRKGLATGAYTQDDYNTWRANFGTTTAGAAAVARSPLQSAVPEPSALSLTVLLLAMFTVQRRDPSDVRSQKKRIIT
jgi:hypothetical protein